MKSKYLNKEFNGWTVVNYTNEKSRHKRYILIGPTYKNSRGIFKEKIIVRDNELTNLINNKITIERLRDNKFHSWFRDRSLTCWDVICVSK